MCLLPREARQCEVAGVTVYQAVADETSVTPALDWEGSRFETFGSRSTLLGMHTIKLFCIARQGGGRAPDKLR